jgi:ligand-binding sensor domain-containing protein/DNA-binding CsgD family transcriptional regulator
MARIIAGKLFRFSWPAILLLLTVIAGQTHAQIKETGLPFINNYAKSVYNAGTQNWSITQNSMGFMYFGNNDGLLEYDGQSWQTHLLPVQTIIRSLLTVGDTVYSGSFEEIGFFALSSGGEMEFNSLTSLIPEPYRSFSEVWKIHKTPDGIVFQSFLYIFIYRDQKITVIKPESSFTYSFFVNGKLLVVDKEKGIFELTPSGLKFRFNHPLFQQDEIRSILETDTDELLIGTFNNGIFVFKGNELTPWESSLNNELTDNALYSAIRLQNGFYVFGTVRNGLYITDANGTIYQHLNRQKGLQNNTILSLYEDNRNNLWIGLDNGIDYVEINSPLSILNYTYNIGSSYATIEFRGNLYVGTNQGLYTIELKSLSNRFLNNKFSLIKGTEGQVWSLKVIDNQLLCGHNYGCFLIEGNKATRISGIPGFWDFLEYNGSADTLLAGTYDGLVKMTRNNQSWKVESLIKGFSESCRFVEEDSDGSLWISHGYRGLFHLELKNDLSAVRKVTLYNKSQGLPEVLPYNLNKINNQILVSTKDGFFAFNKKENTFVRQTNFNEIFKGQDFISKIVKDKTGNFWHFSVNKMGVYRLQEDGGYNNIEIPFYPINKMLIPYFESIYLHDEKSIFIGSQNGLIHYNPEFAINYRHANPVYIRKVTFENAENPISFLNPRLRGEINAKSLKNSLQAEMPFRNNSISFSFTSPGYERQNGTLYSYRLVGFEKNWSAWDKYNFKEYTNLREGIYTFEVKAMTSYHSIGEISTYTFRIKPPLHRSVAAYFVYTILFILLIIGNLYYQKKRIEKARANELEKHEKELSSQAMLFREQALIQEKEIVNLRNETLVNEMNHKNRELANSTLNLLHKNKILTSIKLQLSDLIHKSSGNNDQQHEISGIVRKINKELGNEKHQEAFDSYFDEVHQDFIKRLKEAHPGLSPKELRLCAYLKMNLSSKEISSLMNISVRGVEISRYRLRKKLNLDRETNLTDYILNF